MKPDCNTVLDLFRRQVRLAPDQTALVYENTRLTYRRADELSDNLAAYIESQVPPKSVVGIMLGRNETSRSTRPIRPSAWNS